jgi:glycosyltransferase involved in cell wall biosynthesis
MACGVPVLATRLSGVATFVEDGVDGSLIPPGDPAALVAALDRALACGEKLRDMGLRGRRKVEKSYSWDTVAGRLEELYADVRRRRA